MNIPCCRGFTLIELVTVISVIAILSAIAYPTYHNVIRKGRRADVQQALMEAAQKQENYYAKNARYTSDLTQLGYPNRSWNDTRSASATTFYQIRVNNPNSCNLLNCYVLESRSLGDQANDVMKTYRLWSTGRKQIQLINGSREGW